MTDLFDRHEQLIGEIESFGRWQRIVGLTRDDAVSNTGRIAREKRDARWARITELIGLIKQGAP